MTAAPAAPAPDPLAGLFPPWVARGSAVLADLQRETAQAEELACLSAAAIQKRRDDFSLGRLAARRALLALGVVPQPVTVGPDRSPVWPHGLVGAITHTGGQAAAVVAPARLTAGLGLDVEGIRPLREDIARMVADAEETAWIAGDTTRLLSLFSAKESVYKAFYRHRREYFGFDAVHLRWTGAGFAAELREAMGDYPAGHAFEVRCVLTPQQVWTAVCLPPPAA